MTQADAPKEEPQAPVAFGATVTILFSDIRGFTEYTEEHGDEAAYRMLQHHNTLIEEQIALYGGHIVKSLGDSYMVSFDAARTAVTCAVAMQRAMQQYNRTQQGPKIEIGIGINTGEPVRDADDLFGGAVNLASRVCAAAEAGRVLVSETVRHVVGRMEGSEWIDRGSFELKGFQEPQRLFEVDWSGATAVRATRVAPPPGAARASMEAPPPQVAPSPLPVFGIERRRPWLLWAGAAAAVLLLVGGVIGGVVFLVGRSPTPPGVVEPPAETPAANAAQDTPSGKLLLSDDFSDPAKGLFMDKQWGTSRGTFSDGKPYEYQWEYGYADKALVARLKGPYPADPELVFPYQGAPAADKVLGDFAVEVRAQATRTPERARYAIDYVITGEDRYRFEIAPSPKQYGISLGPMRRNFMARGRSSEVNSGSEENYLRMEVRGDTMKVVLNGREVDQAQHEGLARRGGTIELAVGMFGPPKEGEVEVRFMDFKVYSLEP